MKKNKFLITVFFISSITLVGCSQTQFSPSAQNHPLNSVTGNQPVNPEAPTPKPTPAPDPCTLSSTRLTKVLFMVDSTGSNYGFFGSGGSDPKKKFRLNAIQNFFNTYRTHTNIQWSFMTFAGNSVSDYIGHSGIGAFTNNIKTMQTALDRFARSEDWGDTPYKAALKVSINSILADPDLNTPSNPQYYVVMLTDGFPTDIESEEELNPLIQQLNQSAVGRVSLSTVFYGAQNTDESKGAIQLLSQISQSGHGQFENVNDTNSGLNINDLILPNCGSLKIQK